jgi:hypothetical protein
MANTIKIAPVVVTVSFTVDAVTSIWEGRADTALAGLNAGFVDVASAEIISVEAATVSGEALVATGKVGKGRDHGRLSFAVEVPKTTTRKAKVAPAPASTAKAKATRSKAKAAPAPAPAPEADRIAKLEAMMLEVLQKMQK